VIRLLAIGVAWLLVGATVGGAAYWGLLLTPESTVWSLGLSIVLAALVLAVAFVTVNAAMLAAVRRQWSWQLVSQGTRQALACVPPLLAAALAWWLVARGEAWVDRYAGEISAWFIATFDWADVTWLFAGVRWLGRWLRWVVIPVMALVWLRGLLTAGWRPTPGLLREAISPVRLLVASVAFALLVWAPWTYLVPWRPTGLPLSGEIFFVGAKLGLTALLAATGLAVMIGSAADGPRTTNQGRGTT
jgi:hypothetical protein